MGWLENLDREQLFLMAMLIVVGGGYGLFLAWRWAKGLRKIGTKVDDRGKLTHVYLKCPDCKHSFFSVLREWLAECPKCRKVFEWKVKDATKVQEDAPKIEQTYTQVHLGEPVFQTGTYDERKRKARNARKQNRKKRT